MCRRGTDFDAVAAAAAAAAECVCTVLKSGSAARRWRNCLAVGHLDRRLDLNIIARATKQSVKDVCLHQESNIGPWRFERPRNHIQRALGPVDHEYNLKRDAAESAMPDADASANGSAADQRLVRELEDPWAQQPNQGRQDGQTGSAQRRTSAVPGDEWNTIAMLTRRSRSLELDIPSSQLEHGPPAVQPAQALAEAPARSWTNPFARRKKEKKAPSEDSSLEASGRTVFSAELQRAASANNGSGRHRAAQPAPTISNGAAKPAAAAGDASGSRRLMFSRYSEPTKDRPASAAPLASAGEMLTVDGRSKSGTEASSSSRWNLRPFIRGQKSPAAVEPQQAATGANTPENSVSKTVSQPVSQPASQPASQRSSTEGEELATVMGAANCSGPVPSPFAQGSLTADPAAAAATPLEHGSEVAAAEGGKKGHHRRGRSFSAMLNPLKMKGRRGSITGDELDAVADEKSGRSVADGPPQRPKTPDPTKRASSGALGCFGVGPKGLNDDEAAVVRKPGVNEEREAAMPPGLVGMKNVGNTCFVNAALQCLRHTPGLPLVLLPDLLTMPLSDSAPPTPKSLASSLAADGSARADTATDGSVASAAGSAAGDSPKGEGAPFPIIGVIKDTDNPVLTIAPAENGVLQATPEDVPLVAVVQQSPTASPANSSSDSRHSAAATAAVAAVPSLPPPASPFAPISQQAAAAAAGVAAASDPAQQPAAAGSTDVQSGSSPLAVNSHPILTSSGSPGASESPQVPGQLPPSAAPTMLSVPTVAGDRTAAEGRAAAGPAQQGAAPLEATGATTQSTQGQQATETMTAAPAPVPPTPPIREPPPPLEKGELLEAFKRLVRELYGRKSGAMDPSFLVRRLGTLGAALGEDFTDGGQHDCEEVLSAIIDRLHEDLNRVESPLEEAQPMAGSTESQPSLATPLRQLSEAAPVADGDPPTPLTPATPSLFRPSHRLMMADSSGLSRSSGNFGLRQLSAASGDDLADAAAAAAPVEEAEDAQPDPNESQQDKAERLWRRQLQEDDSPVTDLFGGQLQGNINCHACKGRFTRYEFFKGLSLPLVRETRGGLSSWFSNKPPPSSIQDCLAAFTADETLQGDDKEYYVCDECKGKTAATLNMRIHRFPRILMLHIKRFRYAGAIREKLTTNVAFPLKGLKLGSFASEEAGIAAEAGPEYDLYAVINHSGTMAGGHYTATCRTPGAKDQWHTFNDDVVSKTAPSAVATSLAYILFYVRRDV